MNNKEQIRIDAMTTLEEFLRGWATVNEELMTAQLSENSTLMSSAHGNVVSAKAIASRLAEDRYKEYEVRLRATNYYAALIDNTGKRLVVSAYVYAQIGDFRKHSSNIFLLFGVTLIGEMVQTPAGNWVFEQIKLSINWTEGNSGLFEQKKLPRNNRNYQIGDSTPVIISELDAPWNRYPHALSLGNDSQQLAEVSFRQLWGMDQADFGLVASAFADDAEGNFRPIGYLKGRHHIIGQLKDFRMPWPWMQHFVELISVTIHPSGDTATLIMGRVIPQNSHTEEGKSLYGARYDLKLRLENGNWKFTYFEYSPVWFSENDELSIN